MAEVPDSWVLRDYRRKLLLALAGLVICLPKMEAMSESSWATLQREATDALDTNKYWLAEPMLKESVAEAEKFGFDDLRLARAYGELARYYKIRGRFAEAQPWFEREYKVKEVAWGTDPGKLVQSLGSLILFYLEYGTASKAEPLTEDVIAIVEGKMRDVHESAKMVAVKFEKDKPLTAWAGKVAPAQATPLMEWAITCDNIGNAYRAKGNFKQAERLYKEALDVKATILGMGHLSLANSYDSLGILCMENNEFKEAESYFRDALSTTEKTLTPDSPEVYSRLDRLAKCLIKENKLDEAEQLYLKALSLWNKHPSKNGDEARAYFALGCFYADHKRFSPAAAMIRQALERSEKFFGSSSIVLVPFLRKYAYVCYYLGRRAEASYFKARAVTIYGEPLDPKPQSSRKMSPKKKNKISNAKRSKYRSVARFGKRAGTRRR